ncbi:MAG: D-cysteine desulfhydrase family protein [Acidobacteria bacterium]|nr:D-cysteine desulfhydrase family protein [Acidobacteriota bacterium]
MEKQHTQQAIARLNAIPHLTYGHYPTPIEELPRLRRALARASKGCPRIYIKRDDYTGPGFGGNKVRKLEYVLAGAKADGVDVAITVGGLKSNHARVTAALCAKLGLRCILVLNPAAKMHEGLSPASLHLDEMFGAEVHRIGSREERTTTIEAIAERVRREGKKVIVIPLGASIPLGALGYVRGVQEAKIQLESMKVRIDYIFHSSSSGGTQAGLVAGDQLFNLANKQVIGVSPDDSSASISAEVIKIVRGVGEMLELPPGSFNENVTVLDEYIGVGYGIDTPESQAAIELLARIEGVLLDPVYTAKAMAGLIDWIKCGKLNEDETVLFWHTGGQLAMFYVPDF